MLLKKDTYKKIICLLMPALLLLPALIMSLHVILHHHDKTEHHYHDTTTFCNDEVSLCNCNDFTFTFFSLTTAKTPIKLGVIIVESIRNNTIENIYFKLFLGYKKGRSPPNFL